MWTVWSVKALGCTFPISELCEVAPENEELHGSLILLMPGQYPSYAEQHFRKYEMATEGEGPFTWAPLATHFCCWQSMPRMWGKLRRTFYTDCEFPVFNVFHPEPIFRPNIYISNSSAFGGSYTLLHLMFSHKIYVTVTQMKRNELPWMFSLVCFVRKFSTREVRITVFSHLTETFLRINTVVWY